MIPNQPQPIQSLSEIVNQAANRAAAAFAEMLSLPVNVQLSRAELIDKRQVNASNLNDETNWGKAVHIHFEDGASGEALFLLPAGHDANLVAALFEQIPALQDAKTSADIVLLEIGNVLLNACVGTIANQMGKHISYQVPELIESPIIAQFIDPDPSRPLKLIRMMSTLGVGDIEVSAYIVLIFYTDDEQDFRF
jgi:chemotaxis protein CheC